MATSNNNAEPEIKSGCTSVNVVKLRYFWNIKNFSFCPKDLKSPIFSSNALKKLKWQITMSWERTDYLSLYLLLVSAEESSVQIRLKFSLLNVDGIPSNTSETGPYSPASGKKYGFQYYITREMLENASSGYLIGDCLNIVCDIAMMDGRVNCEELSTQMKANESSLSEDFSKLLDNQKFSDVTIIVKNTEFQAHKAILASRSRVFSAMFDHKMQESNTNRIEIDDIDVDVAKEMLRFIYTGVSSNLESMAGDLLAAADKYVLQDLKRICISVLSRNISVDTAVKTLIFADLYHADRLKMQAIDLINANCSIILKTGDWKELKVRYPQLCIEIYERLHNHDENEKSPSKLTEEKK